MKVVIFARVSGTTQDYTRQTTELKEYAEKMNWQVLGVFEEKISGGKKNEDRSSLMEMIEFIKSNEVNKVLCWELSRIGRNTLEVLKTIEILNQNCISLYIKNYNIETMNEKCEVNPLSQFMIQILTSISEMERTTIRQRIKSGYDHYRNNGGKVGRKEGYQKSDEQFLQENKDVVKLLKQGYPIRKVMGLTDRSSGLVQKVKKLMEGKKKK
jgi:DNA invertase Pin-like site-specific DNA recombinase